MNEDYVRKLIELAERRIRNSLMPEKNKKIIFDFQEHLIRQNMSNSRICKYLDMLAIIGRDINKEFDLVDKIDVEKYITIIQKKNYSEWTKHTYKVIIKRFFKWQKGFEETDDYPLEVSWIKSSVNKNRIKLPNEGDLLNEAEIKKILEVITNSRDKAFISTLWESGARIGEVLGIRIKDMIFDNYGTLVTISGKTGSRKIRLISSSPYLMNWLHNHPSRNDRNAFLWINIGNLNRGQAFTYIGVKKLLHRLFLKVGVNKKCNPHSFRHARATFLANHLTEFQMNQYFGWVQGSKMPSTYVHLSGKNTDSALLKLHGIVPEELTSESQLKPVKCPRCQYLNEQGSNFCIRCGSILDSVKAAQFEGAREELENKERTYNQLLVELLKENDVIELIMNKLKTRESTKLSNTFDMLANNS